jgi:hypothetical protein
MAGPDLERDPNFSDERRRGTKESDPEEFQPDPLLRKRVGPVMGGSILAVGLVLAAFTIWLATRPPPPLPTEGGAALNTERTITGRGAPAPGARATGTAAGPSIRTAPPPVRPAAPVVDEPPAQLPPDHPPVPPSPATTR